jgi:integrase
MATKRANGEGSIYQRAGRRGWFASVTVDGRRKILHAETRREVDQLLTAAKAARQTGDLVVGKSPSVEAFLAAWLEQVIQPNRSVWTWRGYRAAINTHVVPVIGKVKLDRLVAQHMLTLITKMRENGASPKTIANVRALLRSALNTAKKWKLITGNPAADVDPPKSDRREIHPFTPVEAKAFLAAVRSERLEALYTVALTMGLRQAESLGLHWSDIDLEAGTLAVRRQLQRVDGHLVDVPLKTARSRRTLTMPAIVTASLREHRERQRREGGPLLPTAYVFTTSIGTPLEARNVVRSFKAVLEKAGLRNVRFHDLRHSTATLLLVQGVASRVVMEILGHSQISTTTNTYQHVVPELQREAAARIDALLRG